jgi:8-oxo-dGTP pyrophosphatase MutT (NUDIX family)
MVATKDARVCADSVTKLQRVLPSARVAAVPRPWQFLRSEPVLEHRWFRVRRETVQLPNGRVLDDYFVAVREDFALIAAVTGADELVLVRQWKQGIRAVTLELPGGIIDDEEPAAGAARELAEETGYACLELRRIGGGPLDASKETNSVHYFLGSAATLEHAQELDETEEIEVVLIPLDDARAAIARGEIDAPTSIAGIYLALETLGRL